MSKRPFIAFENEQDERVYNRHVHETAQQTLSFARQNLLRLQYGCEADKILADKLDEVTSLIDKRLADDLNITKTSVKGIKCGTFDFNIYNDLLYDVEISMVRLSEMLAGRNEKSLKNAICAASHQEALFESFTAQIDWIKSYMDKVAEKKAQDSQRRSSLLSSKPPNIKKEHAKAKRARRSGSMPSLEPI